MTFVSVGNGTQPFSRLLDAVLSVVSQLPQPVVVQHGNSPFKGIGCISLPFIEMEEFIHYLEEAELLIVHAGAGSIIHAIQAGKVPVVMPRLAKHGEIVDNHQLEFARALAETGKIVVVEKPGDLEDAASEALRWQKKALSLNEAPRITGLIGAVLREYAKGVEK